MRFGRRAPDPAIRRSVRWGLAVGAAAAMFVTTSAALAGFSSLASDSGTLSTKRIFAGVRSAWPSDVRDASGGAAETNSSDVLSYADGLTVSTKNWSSAFAATRFDDFDFSGGRPAGVPVTSATFNFTFAPSRSNDDACFYVEVRRASTNALLGTHGSSGSPSACSTGATVSATVSVSAEVTSTDIANDLRIRVYANNSTNRPIKIDLASVSITTPWFAAALFLRLGGPRTPGLRLDLMGGAVDGEARPLAHLGIGEDVAARLFDDAIDGRKSQARALADFLGREEGLEDLAEDAWRNAGAGVGNRQRCIIGNRQDVGPKLGDLVRFHGVSLNRQRAATLCRHGVAGID